MVTIDATELASRLRFAAEALATMSKNATLKLEADRLDGKRHGVLLALSYVGEMTREPV